MSNLIIGASSGLGREIASEFARNSKDVILVSRSQKDLEILKSDLEIKYKIKVTVFQLDFSEMNQVSDFISNNQEMLERLEGVLFPIGMMKENDNVKISKGDLVSIFSANFYCIIFFITQILNIFEKQNKGYLVGFGSISGAIGRDVNTTYSCAKRALENFFESLIISNLNNQIKIQFYTLGYLDTNLSFDKKLLLPKGSPSTLSKIVYKNLDKKGVKRFFPFWWIFIDIVIKIMPFFITKKIIKYFN